MDLRERAGWIVPIAHQLASFLSVLPTGNGVHFDVEGTVAKDAPFFPNIQKNAIAESFRIAIALCVGTDPGFLLVNADNVSNRTLGTTEDACPSEEPTASR